MYFFRLLLVANSCLVLPCYSGPCPWVAAEVKAQPTKTSLLASHLAAAAAGIDIYGEIPSDYLHKNGSAYHFAPGSNASIWVRAQVDKPWATPDSTLSKRQSGSYAHSGLSIGVWGEYDCEGYGTWIDNVEYIIDDYARPTLGFYSTAIAGRAMYSWEHLDYSTWNGISYCGNYLYSAGYETPPGCWSSMNFYCFRLWYD